MANPQLANGHTEIANEILEHLILLHLPPNQWQVLLYIIRKTYGFHKKVDHIANSQIITATGLCKAVISRALHSLADSNIISRDNKTIGLQKDWTQWQKLAISSTSDDEKLAILSTSDDEKLAILSQELAILSHELAESSTKVSNSVVSRGGRGGVLQKKKETITKETIQKKEERKSYGEEFKVVLLSDEEYQKLIDKFGELGVRERIEALAFHVQSKGTKYQSHYATILNWERRKKQEGRRGKSERPAQGQSYEDWFKNG